MVAPLLFSFSDQDASSTINARVGNGIIRDGQPLVNKRSYIELLIKLNQF